MSFFRQVFRANMQEIRRQVRLCNAEADAGFVGWTREMVGFFFLSPAGWRQLASVSSTSECRSNFPTEGLFPSAPGFLSQKCRSSPPPEHEGNRWIFSSLCIKLKQNLGLPRDCSLAHLIIMWLGFWESPCPSHLVVHSPANNSFGWKFKHQGDTN